MAVPGSHLCVGCLYTTTYDLAHSAALVLTGQSILRWHRYRKVQTVWREATQSEGQLAGWQKQRLLDEQLLGAEAAVQVPVGRDAPGGIQAGISPRLLCAAEIMCASSDAAQVDTCSQAPARHAAALALAQLYLQRALQSFDMDVTSLQVSLLKLALPTSSSNHAMCW